MKKRQNFLKGLPKQIKRNFEKEGSVYKSQFYRPRKSELRKSKENENFQLKWTVNSPITKMS